ncbi:MAG: Beta-glucosidase [Parcubacteria group bacterium GW2011_GWA2_51_12]|nr:MAG: Beta-glucosidase [Parcubacteria group bacterium GW2011_GWA2_51_12]
METKSKNTRKKPKVLKFPEGFLWGAATASYQVEGGITNNDWARSKMPPAGLACDHYHRYEEDFRIAKKLGMNAQRISLEWSRIEPERDVWNEDEIYHYQHVLECLKRNGFTTFVTLQHLTLPVWVAKAGGWSSKATIKEYTHYVSKVAVSLGHLIDFWITVNEPSMHASFGYNYGTWPPFKRSFLKFLKVYRNMLDAHNRAYEMIHGHYPSAMVGFTHSIAFNEAANRRSFFDSLVARFANLASIKETYLRTKNDFLGVNYYFHNKYQLKLLQVKKVVGKNSVLTDKGWEIYPRGLYEVLKKLSAFKKPIYITENGVADARDVLRAEFIRSHVKEIHRAIKRGSQVRGYFYWSLLDNYEWPVDKRIEKTGYEMKFGLVKVDFEKGLKRIIRPSARVYAEICRTNSSQ